MSAYADIIEEIIVEMKSSLPKDERLLIGHEYFIWLDFLKKIKPESRLLTSNTETKKEFSDIREVMLFAETNRYPTLYIQPHFTLPNITLIYEQGELRKIDPGNEVDLSKIWAIPRQISNFSGEITGTINKENSYIAYDTNVTGAFLQKMGLLQSAGFTIAEYVLFPTDKIASISSSKLESSLSNFTSKSRDAGLQVDGVVMISDTPLSPGNYTRLIFKLKSDNP